MKTSFSHVLYMVSSDFCLRKLVIVPLTSHEKGLKIKEDRKRDVLNYLSDAVEKRGSIEDFILPAIEEATEEERARIEEVLDELEEEKLITKHDVYLKIFIPRSDEGRKMVKRFAARGILSYSPYWLFIFSVAILWVAVPHLNLGLPSGVEYLLSAYLQGIQNGIIGAGTAGLIGGAVLERAIESFIKWKLLSPSSYNRIVGITKYTVIILVVGWIGYTYFFQSYGVEFSLATVAIFIASLGVAIAYAQFKTRRE